MYKDRQKHLEEKCEEYHNKIKSKYKKFSPAQTFKNVVSKAKVLHSKNNIPFLFCQIPKVASTSWTQIFVNAWYDKLICIHIYIFLYLNCLRYQEIGSRLMSFQNGFLQKAWIPKNKSAKFYQWSNRNLFSFVIVRHPFDRILSAYRLY